MLQNHIWNAHCSRSMFAIIFLEQFAFQIWSWSIFDLDSLELIKLENSFRAFQIMNGPEPFKS